MPLAASSGGSSLSLLLIILIPVALYFLMIRPQQKRMRETQALQNSLGPGDEVMTSSGIYGTVVEVDTEAGTLGLEVADDVVLTIARGAVAKVLSTAGAAEEDEPDADEESDAHDGQRGAAEDDMPDATVVQADLDAAGKKIIERKD